MSDQTWPRPADVNRVIAKVNSDEAFRSLLLRNANSALAGIGVEIPKGLTVKVHENTASTVNYILPPPSQAAELSDGMLEAVTGGAISLVADNTSGLNLGNSVNPVLTANVSGAIQK